MVLLTGCNSLLRAENYLVVFGWNTRDLHEFIDGLKNVIIDKKNSIRTAHYFFKKKHLDEACISYPDNVNEHF